MFGLHAASQNAVIGVSICPTTKWGSDSAISALVTPGLRQNLQVVVSSAMQVSAAFGNFSYTRPRTVSVSPGLIAASGSIIFQILGDRIGTFDSSQNIRASTTTSAQSVWMSDSSLSSKSCSGFGISRGIRISAGAQVSRYLFAQYKDRLSVEIRRQQEYFPVRVHYTR
jgi:hypothetical protein